MLEKIVTACSKAEMGIISTFSGAETVLEETQFYDVGYMQAQISRIQKELKRIERDLKISVEIQDNSDYGKKNRSELMGQRERLLFRMVFLASNGFKNLDDCVRMADGHSFGFMQCVEGLREYHAGHKEEAFALLEAYYREHGRVEGHFLVNKVFGLLLAEKGQCRKAIPFLTYALQFMPDDVACLESLKQCYRKEGRTGGEAVIGEILAVLR